jgi:hypothetical protein
MLGYYSKSVFHAPVTLRTLPLKFRLLSELSHSYSSYCPDSGSHVLAFCPDSDMHACCWPAVCLLALRLQFRGFKSINRINRGIEGLYTYFFVCVLLRSMCTNQMKSSLTYKTLVLTYLTKSRRQIELIASCLL